MPNQRLLTIALGTLSIPALSFVAYVAAHSVGDNPDPQVILPANTRVPAAHPATYRLDEPAAYATGQGSTPSSRPREGGTTLVTPRHDADNRSLTGGTAFTSPGGEGPGSPTRTGVTSPITATTTPDVDATEGTGHDGTTPGNPSTVPTTVLPNPVVPTSTTDDRHRGADDGSGRSPGGRPDASIDGASR